MAFWRCVWTGLRLEERLRAIDDGDEGHVPPGLTLQHLDDLLNAAPYDIRFHLSRGAAESFANTLPLLHPRGYLQVHDIFVPAMDDYRQGFKGPGKLDGSIVAWVNGALLRAVGARAGYDVHFAPFRYRPGSKTTIAVHDATRLMTMTQPLLPTAVIGSYSMPEWLKRAKNDYLQRRVSRHDLDEMHDAVRKGAIKDQEIAGIDIVSDGELQRDNMIDYFAERMPGVQIDLGSKRFYYDYYDSTVRSKLATGSLGLVDEARILRRFTDRRMKVTISGPHTLVKRIQNQHYPSEEAFALDLARVLNLELRELVRAGVTDLQIDEPYYSGFPEDLPWAIRAVNAMVDGVDAHLTLHICYGNRYGKPSWEGSYRYLFPTIGEAKVQAISLEFARRGDEDLQLFEQFKVPFTVGLGTIDVKTHDVESPAVVADRIRRALKILPAERLTINPDCGLVHLPREVAFMKLCAMVEGTRLVRQELADGDQSPAHAANPLAHALSARRFCYVVELVASALKREAQVLEIGAKLAMVPEIVGGSVTSYAGGRFGQDPVRVATAVRARGLTPNVHLTCVYDDRKRILKTLKALTALELFNVFALTGDYPTRSSSQAGLRPRFGAAGRA